MAEVIEGRKYSKDHEWVVVEGNRAKIGISDYAQDSLGDIVFVELPEIGREVAANESIGVVESVKAVSDIYIPVTGTVVEVNEKLEDTPEAINESPYEEGWICVIEMSNLDELDQLLSAKEYDDFTKEGE